MKRDILPLIRQKVSSSGAYQNDPNWDTSENYAGREYYLAVNAYSFDNESSPVVTAKLKLVQLGKPENPDEVMTGYYSIELISYEYNDAYKMMEDLYKLSSDTSAAISPEITE